VSYDVGVLAHFQTINTRATTHVHKDVAAELVQRMYCERISAKLIRRLAPDSIFPILKPSRLSGYRGELPTSLPPEELPNCFFKQPVSASWRIVRVDLKYMTEEERWLARI
jgi:hypothetical protein